MLIRALILLLFFPFSALAELHVVFDIDWTLVYPLEQAPKPPDSLAVKIGGKWYRYSDRAGELIEHLHKRGDVKVSFFSGGEKTRNLELLKKLKLPSGKSADEIAHKILNADDMTRVSNDDTLKFSERFKKDLRKISPDLDRVVLLDDVKNFVLPGQEKNLLWTGGTYNFAATYAEAEARAKLNPQWEAPSFAAWKRERAKVERLVSRVEHALYEIDRKKFGKKNPALLNACERGFVKLLN